MFLHLPLVHLIFDLYQFLVILDVCYPTHCQALEFGPSCGSLDMFNGTLALALALCIKFEDWRY